MNGHSALCVTKSMLIIKWCCCALAVVSLFMPTAVFAQNAWKPERAVEIVVPTTPGGAIDGAARTIQRVAQANRLVGVPRVGVNKPGGGQTIAMTYGACRSIRRTDDSGGAAGFAA